MGIDLMFAQDVETKEQILKRNPLPFQTRTKTHRLVHECQCHVTRPGQSSSSSMIVWFWPEYSFLTAMERSLHDLSSIAHPHLGRIGFNCSQADVTCEGGVVGTIAPQGVFWICWFCRLLRSVEHMHLQAFFVEHTYGDMGRPRGFQDLVGNEFCLVGVMSATISFCNLIDHCKQLVEMRSVAGFPIACQEDISSMAVPSDEACDDTTQVLIDQYLSDGSRRYYMTCFCQNDANMLLNCMFLQPCY